MTSAAIARRLKKLYPHASTELVFHNDYQLIVCVALSAQCTDRKVNEVSPILFARYADFASLSRAQVQSVEEIIRPINYYRTKAKNLIALAAKVQAEFGGRLPRTHEELLSLPGVGRKTANVVLSETGQAVTFPVDTHVYRVSRRLGVARGNKPEKVEQELMREFAPKDWRILHHAFILHGRRVCKAGRPLCEQCGLEPLCPASLLRP